VDQGVTETSYSSQSKGPDQMLCSAPVRSFGAVDRKQFYVTMSRARRSMHLYTDSIDGLRQAVCRTGERLSAVELANDSEAYLQRMQEVLDPTWKMLVSDSTTLSHRCGLRENKSRIGVFRFKRQNSRLQIAPVYSAVLLLRPTIRYWRLSPSLSCA